ncbi:hypothetical protein M9Y10_036205 [Tritrichomonas musculus]|uniref:MATH domain containing protein n=1 Tax=Tritrichomonas musculus TaxID=1915356 RepID=A0ABR2GUS1_9EUKA
MKRQNSNSKLETKTEQQNRPLICCICHKICRHIQTLPCCRSIACKSCLKEWIEKQDTCPHCGAHLRIPKQKSLCKIHRKSLDYYCQTCHQYLCSDCLFEQIQSNNGQHDNHKIIKTSEIENQPREDLEEYLKCLKSFSDQLDEQFKYLQKQKNSINSKKFNTIFQSNNSFESLKREIELSYQEKQQNYKVITDSLEEKMMKFQTILEESELILTSDDPKMVPAAQNNIEKIKQIDEELIRIDPKPPALDFQNKLSPPFESFYFKIPLFKNCLANIKKLTTENDHIFSEENTLFKCTWRAKIFPNGTQAGKGTHLAVYVELLKGEQIPPSFSYQVEIVSTNDNYPNINRRYTSVFHPMDSWGWNKIITIDKLLAGYLDKDGSLSLKFGIAPSSYKFYIQNKKDEYTKISKEWKQLKKNVEEIKQKQSKMISDDDNSSNHDDI